MKKLLLFLSIFFVATAQAQTNVIFNTLNAGNVTINSQDYERGYITYRWYLLGADTLIELAREYNTSQPFKAGRAVSFFKDGDNGNTAFASFAAWQTWWRTHGAPKPDTIVSGGGGTPANPSTSIQFNNAGAFGGSSLYKWDGAAYTVENNSLTTTYGWAGILTNTTAASTTTNRIKNPPRMKTLGHRWFSAASKLSGHDWGTEYATVGGASTSNKWTLRSTDDDVTYTNILTFTDANALFAGNVQGLKGTFYGTAALPSTTSLELFGGHSYIQQGWTLRIEAGGANPTTGSATLVGGTVTITTDRINTGDHVLITGASPIGTLGHYFVTISDGVSFTITSYDDAALLNNADLSVLTYTIIKH